MASDRAPGQELTEQQLIAIDVIWEHQLTKSWTEIAAIIGVHVDTLWNWRQNPAFIAERLKRSRTKLREYIPQSYEVLVQNMLEGKEWAMKRFHEITGEQDQAALNSHLGAWIKLCAAAGTPQIRTLMQAIEAARLAGSAAHASAPATVPPAQDDPRLAVQPAPARVQDAEVLGDV